MVLFLEAVTAFLVANKPAASEETEKHAPANLPPLNDSDVDNLIAGFLLPNHTPRSFFRWVEGGTVSQNFQGLGQVNQARLRQR